jgi:serine phosphatase RsbU (regulator of sigma subunit)
VKKTENILGISATFLFVAGTLFKFLHWPAAGILLALSILAFNFGYLPVQLILDYRKAGSPLERFYLIFRFLTLFISIFAFVFKIQHWPGAGILLIFSRYLIPLYILFYFYLRRTGRGMLPFHWSDLIIAVLAYTVHMYVSRTLVSPYVVDGYVNLEEEYSKLNAGLSTANRMIYASLDSATLSGDPELIGSLQDLREISNRIYHITDTLRTGFISSIYRGSGLGPPPADEPFDPAALPSDLLASNSQSTDYFFDTPRGAALKSALAEYLREIQEISRKHHLPSSLIGTGFDLEDVADPWGTTATWEEHMFKWAPVASVFTSLSWIRNIVLLTERGMQNQLTGLLDEKGTFRMLEELAMGESKLAMELKENEILRINQQKELQRIQLEKQETELNQRNTVTLAAFAGIGLVLILLTISTRAYMLKQKDNKALALQKEEISGKNRELSRRNQEILAQRDEILAQRDEIEAQRDEIEAQRDLVYQQKEQIANSHHEISASIDYAMRLQDAILPNPGLLEKHFSGHLIFYRPKQKVSGDFYWWTESGSYLIMAVADCTGHGVPGAFMSLLGASLLKEIVNREGITEPGRILDRMREEVILALNQKGSMGEQKDGMEMAVLCLDPQTRKCLYAGAKSPLYLLRRSKLSVYRPDQMPISWYQEMLPFDTVDIQLEPGDQLYMFSDGYADQFGGPDRKKFKYKAFRQVLVEHADLSMPRQQQVLSDTIREWQGNHEQTDDMVVIGVKL